MVAQSHAAVQPVDPGRDSLARRALISDALFCAAAGAILIVASGAISGFTGLEPGWVPAAIGVGVLVWAGNAARLSRAGELRPGWLWLAIAGNLVWVVASYGILIAGTPELTTEGKWTVAILAEIVALLAVAQYLGLRRMR